MTSFTLHLGDVREVLASLRSDSVDCVVTSPPYWGLRDYGHADQLGLETTPEAYVEAMVLVFREVRRLLSPQGTLWLNLGDSYVSSSTSEHDRGKAGGPPNPPRNAPPPGLKRKDLVGIPWRVALALQADGWWLRQDIIWHKPNPMPESVTDRCTRAHEYVFLLTKGERYHYDHRAVMEPCVGDPDAPRNRWDTKTHLIPGQKPMKRTTRAGKNEDSGDRRKEGFNERWRSGRPGAMRNLRSVWTIASQAFRGAHFATFPERLVEPCILAGCPEGGMVLDPFTGSGTTGAVAVRHGRNFLGVELNPSYLAMARDRIQAEVLPLFQDPEAAS